MYNYRLKKYLTLVLMIQVINKNKTRWEVVNRLEGTWTLSQKETFENSKLCYLLFCKLEQFD